MGRGERRGESYFKNEISYSSFHFTVCFRAALSEEQRKKENWGEGVAGKDMMMMIYIHYDECLFVCVFVTKNDHFLLGVSCNHLNPP